MGEVLLLIGRMGDRHYALPCSAVERIVPMASITPLPDAPRNVLGVLDLQGSILPVVDARQDLGMASPAFHPQQRLVVISSGTRYLLWMDGVERTVSVPEQLFANIDGGPRALLPRVVRLDSEVIPVLSPTALDPGPLVQQQVVGVDEH